MSNKVKPEQNRRIRGKLAQSVHNLLRGPELTRDNAEQMHEQIDKIVQLDEQWDVHCAPLRERIIRYNKENWT